MSLVLGNRAFEIHRGDIYIYPPLSKTYIRMLSDDLHGTVGVADFDFVFTLANSISNTQNHLYMRENPCISLNDEQRRRIEELIELIWRRERSQGSRSTNENNRLIYNQLLSSLGKALCCEIAEAYFFQPSDPAAQTGSQGPDFPEFHLLALPEFPHAPQRFVLRRGAVPHPRAISPRSSGKNRAATPCNGS